MKAVVIWFVLLGGILAAPLVWGSADPGDDLVRHTVRLALLYYLVAAVLMVGLDPAAWAARTLVGRITRRCWMLAWLAYIVHLGMAFHFAHGWSHAAAMEHVERRSGFGPGIFMSHFFTLVWTLDVVWWLWRPERYAIRAPWVGRVLHGFMLFITFNATVVYETGTIRYLGLAFVAVLGVAWVAWRGVSQGGPSMHKASLGLTLLALSLTASVTVAQTADEKKATVTLVQSLQAKDGGFAAAAGAEKGLLNATSASLRALRYFGGKPLDAVACKKFVLSCRDAKSGGFASVPGGKPDVITTAVGLMALKELQEPTAPYEKAAIAFMVANAKQFEEVRMAAAGLETVGKRSEQNLEWLAFLGKMSNKDGTFGEGDGQARDTGGAIAAVLRLGGKPRDREVVLKVLRAGQRKDGGFGKAKETGSDLETSYRVMRTFMMLKEQPERPDDLRKFIASCRGKDGGYAVVPGGKSSPGGTYFAGIILHWLDAK